MAALPVARFTSDGLEIGDTHIPANILSRDFTIKTYGNFACIDIKIICENVQLEDGAYTLRKETNQ